MEFETKPQQECYEKVKLFMREIFGEMARVRDDAPMFSIAQGSAWIGVGVWPWGDDDAIICSRSYVVKGAEITPELTKHLLHLNDQVRFGAFGLDKDEDIFFEHTIVGSSCDKNELRASVMAVINSSDHHDDDLVSRFGGKRGLD